MSLSYLLQFSLWDDPLPTEIFKKSQFLTLMISTEHAECSSSTQLWILRIILIFYYMYHNTAQLPMLLGSWPFSERNCNITVCGLEISKVKHLLPGHLQLLSSFLLWELWVNGKILLKLILILVNMEPARCYFLENQLNWL